MMNHPRYRPFRNLPVAAVFLLALWLCAVPRSDAASRASRIQPGYNALDPESRPGRNSWQEVALMPQGSLITPGPVRTAPGRIPVPCGGGSGLRISGSAQRPDVVGRKGALRQWRLGLPGGIRYVQYLSLYPKHSFW